MSEEYPLYPTLNEEAEKEATKRLNKFVEQLKNAADEALSNFYCEDLPHIESDSWQNFRNELMAGFKNYNNRKIQSEYDFKAIRQEIYKEFRDEIVKDLDQDNLTRIKELEDTIEFLREQISRRY